MATTMIDDKNSTECEAYVKFSLSKNVKSLTDINLSETCQSDASSLQRVISQANWSHKGKCGFLIGRENPTSPTDFCVVGLCCADLENVKDFNETSSVCLENFPFGTKIVGLVIIPSEKHSKSALESDPCLLEEELDDSIGEWLDALGLPVMILLCLWPKNKAIDTAVFTLSLEGFKLVTKDSETEKKTIKQSPDLVRMRLTGRIPINVLLDHKEGNELGSELSHELTRVQHLIQGGNLVYGFSDNTVLLQSGGSLVGSVGVCDGCGDLSRHLGYQLGRGRKAASSPTVMPISILLRATAESSYENQFAPIIRHKTGSFKSMKIFLPLDILVDAADSLSIFDLYSMLNSAVNRQITSLFSCLHRYMKSDAVCSPEVFHYNHPGLNIPITAVYPREVSENDLETERKALHRRLCLPMSEPLLRRGAAGFFLRSTAPGGYLLNPHIGLPAPPVKDATPCLVNGFYSYHHYMQDRFNDDKWGCAYRSLQTIVSWFKYQAYTDKDVPSHSQIQQILVDIGDKPKKFVDSKQWIGSFEVSFVLDNYLGVTSKFINVNAGSELSSIGQQLSHHFMTQGTPVMIGGGVLAHTILGVAYSELTGDISFLILDPHYTGGEDLKVIHDKGWCGWKDMKFWNQTAHYNLCLPQKPNCL